MIGSTLNRREQLFLLGGGVFLLILLVYLGVIAPYNASVERMRSRISAREQQLLEIRSLQQEFQQLQQQTAEVERRAAKGGNFSLMAFLEETALKIVTRDNLVYLRPQPKVQLDALSEESLEIKLEKIRLDQLVNLLYATETADTLLKVKSLRSKARFDDPTLLDVVLVIAAYGKST
jgi:general secretion pathway protein M